MISFEQFRAKCNTVGLSARECTCDHWQILPPLSGGGKPLVNFWPGPGKILRTDAKPGSKAYRGNEDEAIAAARKAAVLVARSANEAPDESLAAVDGSAMNGKPESKRLRIVIDLIPSDWPGSRPGAGFHVRTGDRSAEGLCFDEMLALVAAIAMPEDRRQLQWLKTPAQHAAEEQRHQERCNARAEEEPLPY
jgi:hypothetical protein